MLSRNGNTLIDYPLETGRMTVVNLDNIAVRLEFGYAPYKTASISHNGEAFALPYETGQRNEETAIDLIRIPERTKQRLILFPRNQSVRCTRFNRAATLLAIGLENGTIVVVDVRSKEIMAQFKNDRQPAISALAFSADDHLLCSGADNGSLVVWDLRMKKGALLPFKHKGEITGIEYGQQNKCLFTLSDVDGPMQWDERGTQLKRDFHDACYGGESLVLAADEKALLGVRPEAIFVIDAVSGKAIRRLLPDAP